MTAMPDTGRSNAIGITLIVLVMVFLTINDTGVKWLSNDYPLHQIVFIRSSIGICITIVLLQFEGGWGKLRTARPGLHVIRALLLVLANILFFAGLATLPLAEATALFFIAPLCITLLSMPLLGAPVGPRRFFAVLVGFAGVVMMTRPVGGAADAPPLWALALPVAAALCYALMQILTRKLGANSPASALSFYIQAAFILTGIGFFLAAGDGRFAVGVENASLQFLFRAWIVPPVGDWWILGGLGVIIGVMGYCLAQAYRLGEPSVIAPFEYVALPFAVLWGFLIWGDLPDAWATAGIVMIVGSGVYVFVRERRVSTPDAALSKSPTPHDPA
ncbi:MAG: DMT family transporter [Alphaproteobacteria bacterium]|nr:DMT family transporter [Alphaproteobacteria bacterium]